MTHGLSRGLIGLTALTLLAGTAAADVLRVPSEFPTIQAAIDAASDGDTVLVASGTYTGEGNRDITFDGKAITVRSRHGAEQTIIDCEGTQQDPHRGFYFGSGEGPDSVLRGFTIRGGSTPPGAVIDEFNGGGILCNNNSSPTIRECIITENWCGCWGAAISCGITGASESSPTIIDCQIINNYSGDDGGALFAIGGSPTLINTLIAGNGADITGGAISNFGNGVITIINCTIIDNEAPYGSAIYDHHAVISNSIIRGNTGSDPIWSPANTITFSNIEGGFVGDGNIDVDPLFVNAPLGDYRLAAGSPLIDAGDVSMLPVGIDTDMAGLPRVHDDMGTQNGIGGAIDIGAHEFQGNSCPADFNHDGTVTTQDVLAFLNAFNDADDAADFNGDGTLNSADVLAFLNAFADGC